MRPCVAAIFQLPLRRASSSRPTLISTTGQPSMSSYTLTPAAHYTLLAHLASHPHADVCGLLLAPAASPRAIARALPLTHTWAALSPLAEAGLALAQAHAREEKCKVVGVYVAHARAGLTEVGARAEMLARRAAEGEALVLVVSEVRRAAGGR